MFSRIFRAVSNRGLLLGFLVVTLMVNVCFRVNAAQNEVSNNNGDLIQAKELFIKARKMFYNAEAPFNEVKNIFNASKVSLGKLTDGYDKYYWQANIEFVLAEMTEVSGEKQLAAKGFTESGALIRKALESNPKSSDANRVLADTIMRLMSYNGTMYKMGQGPHALKLLRNAISLDKQNYPAMNSLGIYYINAPAIGGGNVDKGIQTLLNALESKEPFDNFISYVWLGIAFQKKNGEESAKYFNKALEIYPNSSWAKRLSQGVKK